MRDRPQARPALTLSPSPHYSSHGHAAPGQWRLHCTCRMLTVLGGLNMPAAEFQSYAASDERDA